MSDETTPHVGAEINTQWNLGTRGDDVYAALVDAHESLTDAESQRLNARLVLLLVNHIGDADIIISAIDQARADLKRRA